jgi:nitronate monooxygenase
MYLEQLREPIVQAPLAGGASTPALSAAVSEAGGLGSLATGYKRADVVADDIHELRSLTSAPFVVNIFAPPEAPAGGPAELDAYAAHLRVEAERYGVELGTPRHDDDDFERKLELVADERVAVVSFTFGSPSRQVTETLQRAGCDVWVTVTNPDEAAQARDSGADALVVQGFEAGGHRGYFSDRPDADELGLLAGLRLVANRVSLPLIGAGGIADGATVAAVVCAGAVAAQVGTALMLTPEAGTGPAQRDALATSAPTRLTRAFSGRPARGIVNRFMSEHDQHAPAAYPEVHYLTAPVRAAAREAADASAINLWAGQAHTLAAPAPAAEVIRRLGAEAREASARLAQRLGERAGQR